jgi:hypothetical protein
MLGAQIQGPTQPIQEEQQDGGLLGGIVSFLQENPTLAGSLAGAAAEGLTGGDVGLGAEQGLLGAERIFAARQAQAQAQQAQRLQVLDIAKKQENVLAKRFDPIKKRQNEIRIAQDKIDNSLSQGTAAGDLAGIFAFMKVLDPGSTVREGEFANAQNSAGVPDRVRNLYNQSMKGTRLGLNQRKDFLTTARNLYKAESKTFNLAKQEFSEQASRQGLDLRNVVGKDRKPLTPINDLLLKTEENVRKLSKEEAEIEVVPTGSVKTSPKTFQGFKLPN